MIIFSYLCNQHENEISGFEMNWLDRIQNMRIMLVLVATVLVIASLLTSSVLINDLQDEERGKMKLWAEAIHSINEADADKDVSMELGVIQANNTIPVIVVDETGEVMDWSNIDKTFYPGEDSIAYIKNLANAFRDNGNVIEIAPPQGIEGSGSTYVLYDESLMLKRLAVYPYIQMGVVIIFVVIAIFALFATTKAEQNKVWVGLSKETAHQLGTPISSLMAWYEVLKETYPEDELLPEMEKDIRRLERVAERFSKIGSIPEPKPDDLIEVLQRVVSYMSKRTSAKVKITTHFPDEPIIVNLISSLFEWVAENLCKNAVDAMGGSGSIDIYADYDGDNVVIEFTDTGKGIAKSNFGSVFMPGFTTKERGWGLGLSLAKRIVEEYHKGKIFVKESEVGVGTTFRIELPK